MGDLAPGLPIAYRVGAGVRRESEGPQPDCSSTGALGLPPRRLLLGRELVRLHISWCYAVESMRELLGRLSLGGASTH